MRALVHQDHLQVKPTTPTFLSDVEAAPETNPVVYSPVPTIKTAGGAIFVYPMFLVVEYGNLLQDLHHKSIRLYELFLVVSFSRAVNVPRDEYR
jgi:hypothetical protein